MWATAKHVGKLLAVKSIGATFRGFVGSKHRVNLRDAGHFSAAGRRRGELINRKLLELSARVR